MLETVYGLVNLDKSKSKLLFDLPGQRIGRLRRLKRLNLQIDQVNLGIDRMALRPWLDCWLEYMDTGIPKLDPDNYGVLILCHTPINYATKLFLERSKFLNEVNFGTKFLLGPHTFKDPKSAVFCKAQRYKG